MSDLELTKLSHLILTVESQSQGQADYLLTFFVSIVNMIIDLHVKFGAFDARNLAGY